MCDTCGCTTKPADDAKCAVCDKGLSECTCETAAQPVGQPPQPTTPPIATPVEETKQK